MTVGSKYKFYVPGELAYGAQGGPQGSNIGPNQVLVFEVELLSIEKEMPKEEKPQADGNADIQKMIEEQMKKQQGQGK
jgi:hypothetical protein